MTVAIDLTGRRFGELEVVGPGGHLGKHKNLSWLCRCDCGIVKVVRGLNLRHGRATTCGHTQAQHARELTLANTKWTTATEKVFEEYRNAATARDLQFDLNLEQFGELVQSDCFYCGQAPSRKVRKCLLGGVDRRDNKVGYTVSNCVPCCSMCNMAKRGLTAGQFINLCQRVANHK